ncbi:peroxisome biogenesis factor 2-like isoform X2 [Acanthaster planci]|uniref:Peroxisome biogenesis factor 2 n=1 Tax=Acanthaster planci TaxID=133434 RepID=A0A8B7YDD4_ACAPL|nr:peroxisome biogenesis factor 2-like isoform X2 [Acanthaster planci]
MAATTDSSDPNKGKETGPGNQIVLRVSQLDSNQLDGELHQLLKAQFQRIFQFFKPGVLAYIEPELNAALRLLMWQFSINSIGATLGQRIMNLKYGSEATLTSDLSQQQRLLYAGILIGAKWLQDRSADLASSTNHIEAFQRVSFEFMTRELLWHGFAEFLFFVLPFINFRRVRNFLQRKLFRPSPTAGVKVELALRRDQRLYKECAVCGEWPTTPRHIGCQHVFCYYCVQSNFLADPAYTCPLCSHPVDDVTNIQPITCDVR